MELYRCCFTGHRQLAPATLSLLTAHLDAALSALYQSGCRHFYAGGALGFDTLAAERVLAMKKTYADIRLHLLLPCRGQSLGWEAADIARYEAILAGCDTYQYISEHYYAGAMAKRNQALIAHADVCIAFLQREKSGAGQTVRAAQAAGIPVINLADRLP